MVMAGDYSIVGVWEVHAPNAPFPYHLMTFHADGTMMQTNPDVGSRPDSDSAGMGVWVGDSRDPGTVFTHRTVIAFQVTVLRDHFGGSAETVEGRPGQPAGPDMVTILVGRRLTAGAEWVSHNNGAGPSGVQHLKAGPVTAAPTCGFLDTGDADGLKERGPGAGTRPQAPTMSAPRDHPEHPTP